MSMILAVIPARGGSKRLPGKNIAPFGGHPLLWWSVALAMSLENVRCVVSTEDHEIGQIAAQSGAEVVNRPLELAGDESSITQVLAHAVRAATVQGQVYDGIMLLQPTNPLRPLSMVRDAIARFLSEPCDSLISVSRRSLKIGRIESGAFVRNYAPDSQSRTTPPTFYENGLLYLTKSSVLLDRQSIYGDHALAFETHRPFDDVDIDEPVDLMIGEAILASVRGSIEYA